MSQRLELYKLLCGHPDGVAAADVALRLGIEFDAARTLLAREADEGAVTVEPGPDGQRYRSQLAAAPPTATTAFPMRDRKRQEALHSLLHQQGPLTATDVALHLGCEPTMCRKLLSSALSGGLLASELDGARTLYRTLATLPPRDAIAATLRPAPRRVLGSARLAAAAVVVVLVVIAVLAVLREEAPDAGSAPDELHAREATPDRTPSPSPAPARAAEPVLTGPVDEAEFAGRVGAKAAAGKATGNGAEPLLRVRRMLVSAEPACRDRWHRGDACYVEGRMFTAEEHAAELARVHRMLLKSASGRE